MKSRRKLVSILLTLSLLVTLLVPMVGPAAAASGYRSLLAPSVTDGEWQALGSMVVEVDAGALAAGHSVDLRLPTDFKIYDGTPVVSVSGSVYQIGDATDGARVKITVPQTLSGEDNELGFADLAKPQVLAENEFKLALTSSYVSGANGYGSKDAAIIKIEFPNVYVKSGFSGDINVTGTKTSNSAFPSGTATIGTVVTGDNQIEISATNVPSFSSDTSSDPVKIRVTEKKPSALDVGSDSLTFKLPSGFKWMDSGMAITDIWGDPVYDLTSQALTGATMFKPTNTASRAIGFVFSGTDKDELKAKMYVWDEGNQVWDDSKITSGLANGADGTNQETSFEITANIELDNEKDATVGDVVVSTSGSRSSITPNEVTVAKYGNYETTVTAKDAPTIYSGELEQRIGDVEIKESVKQSLVKGRTVILTLPASAKWTKTDSDSDSGTGLELVSFPGTDGHEAKWEVTDNSTDAATLSLSKMEVAVEPGFTGDLNVEVSGTAGVTGTITVAKVVAPVSITASTTPDVKIGSASDAGDLTIKEAEGGAIKDKELILDLPEGVRFASTPKVEVTEGNITIKDGDVKTKADGGTDDNQLSIPIDTKSSTASTIKVSGIKLIVDRTVPEGDITVKVKGAAVAEVNDTSAVQDKIGTRNADGYLSVDAVNNAIEVGSDYQLFVNTSTAAKTVLAKVVTPASTDVKAKVVFKIGDTKYTVNGTEMTMDAAPYLKNDRTYLPIRFVAQAVGVTDSNIIWNADEQSVTLIKSGTVVKLVVGSNTMTINGTPVTMDVAPEIVDPGRTMLPVRWVAQALGADIQWDDATQTVTVN